MQLLGSDERKPFAEVETHLVAEPRARAGAGTVGLDDAMLEHMAHEIFILTHRAILSAPVDAAPH